MNASLTYGLRLQLIQSKSSILGAVNEGLELDERTKYDITSDDVDIVVIIPEKTENGDTLHENGDLKQNDLNTMYVHV